MSSSKLDKDQVEKAVKALMQHCAFIKRDRPQDEPGQLLEDQITYFWLTFSTKQLDEHPSSTPHCIPLPHSLVLDEHEVCLFTKDPQQEFKQLLGSNGIDRVNKVMGITKLRQRFKPFEAKRGLCNTYNMFLADDRVIPLLPKLLGKYFFEKKKLPLPVDLTKKNLKAEIERVLSSTAYYETSGNCSSVRIGCSIHSAQQIVENVMQGFERIVKLVPGEWANIKTVYLKTSESIALPVYVNKDEMTDEDTTDIEASDLQSLSSVKASLKRKAREEESISKDPFFRRLFKQIKLKPNKR